MKKELTKIIDDFGKTVYGKESCGEEYAIIEIEKKYCDIAINRIEKENKQLKLFT